MIRVNYDYDTWGLDPGTDDDTAKTHRNKNSKSHHQKKHLKSGIRHSTKKYAQKHTQRYADRNTLEYAGRHTYKDSLKEKDININNNKSAQAATDLELEKLNWLMDTWNNLVPSDISGIGRIRPGTKRFEDALAFIRDSDDVKNLKEALSKIENSDYLMGKKDQTPINFDWFIKLGNIDYVFEGKYKNSSQESETGIYGDDTELKDAD